MKNTLYLPVAALLILNLLAACASPPPVSSPALNQLPTGQHSAPAEQGPFPVIDSWLATNNMTINAGKSAAYEYEPAFAQGAVIAYGEGTHAASATGAAQMRLTATRAAEIVARRNLAQYLARYATAGELRLSSGTVKLEGFLKGAAVVAQEYNPAREKAAVLLKLDLRGASGFAR